MDPIEKNIKITDNKVGYKHEDKALKKRHYKEIYLLKRNIPNKKHDILDLGCREGLFLSRLSEIMLYNSLIGIDISEKAINYLREHRKEIQGYIGDVNSLPFEDNSFDVIICGHTLEHCPEPQKVMDEIRRVLKPKSYCLLEVPLENTNKDKPRTATGHFSTFNYREELIDLLENNGFKIVETEKDPKKNFRALGVEANEI